MIEFVIFILSAIVFLVALVSIFVVVVDLPIWAILTPDSKIMSGFLGGFIVAIVSSSLLSYGTMKILTSIFV